MEKPLKKCPECKKPKLRRLFGAGAAILFKGSGFYQTDYRSDSYQAAAKADQESSKPASSESSGKSESGKTASSENSGKSESSGNATSSKETTSTKKSPKSKS